jgi:hypothetical protein
LISQFFQCQTLPRFAVSWRWLYVGLLGEVYVIVRLVPAKNIIAILLIWLVRCDDEGHSAIFIRIGQRDKIGTFTCFVAAPTMTLDGLASVGALTKSETPRHESGFRNETHKMKLAKYVAALAINIALMQTTYSERLRDTARPTGSHKKYTRAISLGVRTLAVGGLCGVFDAAASSDDFFAQLRRTDEPDGPTFRVNGAIVKNFPDQILVNIKGPVPCPGSSSIPVPARVSQQLQEALTFDVHWLNGAEKRPAEKLTFSLVQSPFWVLGNRWFYQLQFSGREIPLTATLVVEASTKDGKHLADFTGHL